MSVERASEVEGLVGLGPSPEERARLGCRGFGVHDGGLACDSERDSGVVHGHARTFKPRRVKALGTRPRVGALVYVVGAGGNKRAPSR